MKQLFYCTADEFQGERSRLIERLVVASDEADALSQMRNALRAEWPGDCTETEDDGNWRLEFDDNEIAIENLSAGAVTMREALRRFTLNSSPDIGDYIGDVEERLANALQLLYERNAEIAALEDKRAPLFIKARTESGGNERYLIADIRTIEDFSNDGMLTLHFRGGGASKIYSTEEIQNALDAHCIGDL